MVIWDWDDTLLSTSFINPTGVFNPHQPISPNVMAAMKELEVKARTILEKSIQYGVNYIVTNAGEGWVQYSAKKFMPSVAPLLKNIKIISARSKYESVTTDYTQWKVKAFMEAAEELEDVSVRNILCLGDN